MFLDCKLITKAAVGKIRVLYIKLRPTCFSRFHKFCIASWLRGFVESELYFWVIFLQASTFSFWLILSVFFLLNFIYKWPYMVDQKIAVMGRKVFTSLTFHCWAWSEVVKNSKTQKVVIDARSDRSCWPTLTHNHIPFIFRKTTKQTYSSNNYCYSELKSTFYMPNKPWNKA